MEKVITKAMFKVKRQEINMLEEVLKIKIFCLAMIIMAEIQRVSITRGADRESESRAKLE